MSRFAPLLVLLLLLGIPLLAAAQEFIPLTSVPAFKQINETGGLSGFLNQIYILCVGAAAVIAVIQLVRAGMLYSLGDSFTEKKEAKHLITMSLLGLVLVLSPTIVFGIINPAILELRIDATDLGEIEFEELEEDPVGPEGVPDMGSISLVGVPANEWGTFDNACNFTSDWFNVYRQLPVKAFGGENVQRGRQCCALTSGSLERDADGEEVCNLSGLIDGDRYIAKIYATVSETFRGTDGKEHELKTEVSFYTPGGGGGHLNRDLDTIAIHGFRREADCKSFISNLTPTTLFTWMKERKWYLPAIGLLESNMGANAVPEIERVVSINNQECTFIGYGEKQ